MGVAFILRLFKSIPFQLFLVVCAAFILGPYIPDNVLSFLFTVSLVIKSILIFLLPIIIFGLVFHSFSRISGSAFLFPVILILLVCISNFSAVFLAYFIGLPLKAFISSQSTIECSSNLLPLFDVPVIKMHEHANFFAIVFGIGLGTYSSITKKLQVLATNLSRYVSFFLTKVFLPVLPIFVLGFILKLYKDGMLVQIFKNFAPLCITIILSQWIYITLGYFGFSSFNFDLAKKRILNILPACLVGFSTMSSAATLPTLIECSLKNAKDKSVVGSVVPSVINSHMLGDAIAIPIMAFSILSAAPSFINYFYFAIAFMFNKFAAAGVPGGTILVMIPVLENYLGFTSEMSALILMMYLLFDGICTMASIYGNGLYPIVFEKIWGKVTKQQKA